MITHQEVHSIYLSLYLVGDSICPDALALNVHGDLLLYSCETLYVADDFYVRQVKIQKGRESMRL